MRFQAVHKLVSYLLVSCAAGSLLSTGAVPALGTILLLLAGVASWFVEPDTWMGRLFERTGLVFNLGALAFFGVSLYQVISSFPEPDLSPVLNLILFLLVYKLCFRRNTRDYLQLYVLTFLVMLAAAWLAQGVLFVIGFGGYVITATWTLILFHLRHEIEDNYLVKHWPESASEKVTAARVLNSRRVVGRPFFLVTGLVAVSVLIGAAAVFLSVPRIGLGFLSGAVRRRAAIVGFSDEVRLGHHGVISSDNQTVVLRAQVPYLTAIVSDADREQAVAQLYWRGTVYDRYHDAQWVRSQSNESRTHLRDVLRRDGGDLRIVEGPESASEIDKASLLATSHKQVIQVVALSFPVAFALDRPAAFERLDPPRGSFVTTDFERRWSGEVALRPVSMLGAHTKTLAEFGGGQYIAYSRPAASKPGETVATEQLPKTLVDQYLEVPSTLRAKVAPLAMNITQAKTTPSAKVDAIVAWLRKTHTYTVDLKRDPSVPDPVEDFLFKQTAGHCEYFASAAAILLRLSGVPSRYVHGFYGGEWNAIGKHVTVRDNRAHAWVEAYLGPLGWVRVDATPVSAVPTRMGRLLQLFDSMELFWSRWVIQYDASSQLDLARRLGRQIGFERPARGRTKAWRPKAKTVGAAVGVLAFLVFAWRLRRMGWRQAIAGRPRAERGAPAIFRLYHKALDRLAAKGFPRGQAETPTEFAARVSDADLPGADAMRALTRHYTAARYGERQVPDEVLRELTVSVDEIGRGQMPAPPSAPAPGA